MSDTSCPCGHPFREHDLGASVGIGRREVACIHCGCGFVVSVGRAALTPEQRLLHDIFAEPVPTGDQSYCDVGDHQHCSGYSENEADPESCMCDCHDDLEVTP